MRRLSAPRGLTLLELAVAIVVLAIGSLAAIRTTDQSRRAIGGEMPRLLAQIAARNRIEELQLFGRFAAPPRQGAELAGQRLTLTEQRETTAGGLERITVTARADSGEGASLVAYLPRTVPR